MSNRQHSLETLLRVVALIRDMNHELLLKLGVNSLRVVAAKRNLEHQKVPCWSHRRLLLMRAEDTGEVEDPPASPYRGRASVRWFSVSRKAVGDESSEGNRIAQIPTSVSESHSYDCYAKVDFK